MAWDIIGPILAAFAGAAGGGFAKEWLVDWYFAPKLRIQNSVEMIPGGVRYYHALVKNEGKRAAQTCCPLVTIEGINPESDVRDDTTGNGVILGPRKFLELRDTSLSWSGGDPAGCTINVETPASIDLFRLRSTGREVVIDIPSEKRWSPYRVCLILREYRGTLKVTSANARPVERKFTIKPTNMERMRS